MGNRLNIPIGKRFGKLVVLSPVSDHITKKGCRVRRFCAICDCGERTVVRLANLRQGITKSCGCIRVENTRRMKTTHGKAGTRVYKIWMGMLNRCSDPRNRQYKLYGGRGIEVCKEWRSFEQFYQDMGDSPVRTSIDRIDNDGNYCKANCRWATSGEQANNKRNNVRITINGETKTMSQWARAKGLNPQTIHYRIKAGWPTAMLLVQP